MKLNSTCKICNKSFNTIGQLGRHIYSHNITGKIYYDMFFKENNEGLCENCGKPTEFYKFSKGYRKTCCNKCYRELSVKNWRSTMNDKYDGKYYSSTDEFNEKRKQTCLEKYGSEFYLIKNNIKYVYQPNIIFEYNDINKKPHKYLPDFLINDKEIIEIKGPHFFDINGNFIDPYDKSKEAQYNAQLKYKCMIDNNVTILQKNDLENLGIILI